MRLRLAFALLALPALAFAQPRILENAGPPPVPAAEPRDDSTPEPQVTIRKERDRTVAEYRLNGKLYMMKVTQSNGLTYYLVDERGDGQFTRRDSLDSGLRVPMWVIKSW